MFQPKLRREAAQLSNPIRDGACGLPPHRASMWVPYTDSGRMPTAIYFVIAFVGRSGSSYLQGLLDSHRDARCLGEIFWSFDADPARQPVREFLNDTVHSTNRHVSGFKFGNMHILKHPEVKDVMNEYEYRVIHLSRRNRVDQYISMRLAQLNELWRSDQGVFRVQSFTADFEHMDYYLKLIEEHDRLISEYICGFPTKKIDYEDLVGSNGYFPVLDFLELERMKLQSPFLKQRSGSQRDALLNFDEVLAHYKGTPTYELLD